MAVVYKSQKNYEKALNYQQKSLKIKQKRNDVEGIATSYGNIGILYYEKGDYKLSEKYLLNAITLYEKLKDKNYLIAGYNNLGLTLQAGGKYEKALEYQYKTLALAKQINFSEGIIASYEGLASVYAAMGDHKKGYEFHLLYSQKKDSVLNETNSRQINEMQAKYESEKKDKELLKKETEAKRKNIILWAVGVGLLLVIIFSGFVVRSLQTSKTKNKIISEQKHLVEEKQKEILDSIRYAKRIQQSLLPTQKYIFKKLNDLKKIK